ncbi:hypothetical protein [Mesorhizobium sp. B2-4-17]|uniref:hypothetical protein n=1 Tax=Mesorhizobium sp. B2-4-17 TaxID=2589932 RepID=UPI00112B6D8C|nr:hypothetical protein [Mesorhizobium sp. B2-4-17]TPK85225.1 hypothetical protein FJ548_16890 [Mesorhizobium sp. B2-4-17]
MSEMKQGTPVGPNMPPAIRENLERAYGVRARVQHKTEKERVYEALHSDVQCLDEVIHIIDMTADTLRENIEALKKDGVLVLEGTADGLEYATIGGRLRTLKSFLQTRGGE